MMDVLAGNVDLMVSSVPSALGQIRAGKLRALAATSARRSSSLPDVPTVAQSGYPGLDVSTWYGLFLPAGAPREVVDRVHVAVNKLLADPEVVAAIHKQGAEPQSMSQKQFADLVKTDYVKW
jgi:tripartite-type tricarboxylate transporter receptor subunit TctC